MQYIQDPPGEVANISENCRFQTSVSSAGFQQKHCEAPQAIRLNCVDKRDKITQPQKQKKKKKK